VTEGIKRTGGLPVFEILSGLGRGKNPARHLKAAFLDDAVGSARLFEGEIKSGWSDDLLFPPAG